MLRDRKAVASGKGRAMDAHAGSVLCVTIALLELQCRARITSVLVLSHPIDFPGLCFHDEAGHKGKDMQHQWLHLEPSGADGSFNLGRSTSGSFPL